MSLDMATSKIDPSQMSDEEIELTLELFRRKRERGEPQVVAERAPELVLEKSPVKRRNSKDIDPKWFEIEKVCPHCEKTKNVGRDFGVILVKGKEYAASWCRQCRSEESSAYKARRAAKPKKSKK